MSLREKTKIPIALQVVCDDIGWFNGDDDRCTNGPSRTGIPRRHAPQDYTALNELGRRLNMKIYCPLVLGEWDKDNVLRGMEHATPCEDTWDMKSQIDMNLAEKCFEAAESSEYIEYGFHGLLHGYWINGVHVADSEFYVPTDRDSKTGLPLLSRYAPASPDYLESHIDAFFRIYEGWGFKKKIRAFTSPSGMYSDMSANLAYAGVLKKYGLLYWENGWRENPMEAVLSGVIFLNNFCVVPWNAYDVDASLLYDYHIGLHNGITERECACFGTHWPNYLRYNPEKNIDAVNGWVNYYRRHGNIFGLMLSRDIAFAASQALYYKRLKLDFTDSECIIDANAVDSAGALGVSDEFYLSFASDITPRECTGGTVSLYEKHDGFNNYKIKRAKGGDIIKITF